MAQLVVRNLEDRVKAGLLRRAKRNRRSMEEEARTILRTAVLSESATSVPLGTRFRALFGGVGLDEPIRALRGGPPRAPAFDE
jgi:plasmid stability protein